LYFLQSSFHGKGWEWVALFHLFLFMCKGSRDFSTSTFTQFYLADYK
jgi:hypothetical protein